MINKRRDQIDNIKKEILIELDKIGTYEVTFENLLSKLQNKRFNQINLKKYIGLLFDDDYVDINSRLFKDRAKIKSSINNKTKIQITSNGQDYAYPPKKKFDYKRLLTNPWIVGFISSLVVGLILYFILG